MKTITTNLYKFEELTEEAQEKVMSNFEYDYSHCLDEAVESLKKFCDELGIVLHDYSIGSQSSVQILMNFPELQGNRARTYILNNWGHLLKEPQPQGEYKKRGKSKLEYARFSKVTYQDTCGPFTGVCYDESLLDSIREFVNSPTESSLEDVINEAIANFCNSIDLEIDYYQSDDFKKDELAERGDGEIYTEEGEEEF